MTDIRFDLIMTGNLASGVSREVAINKLAALFKRPPEQVGNLLSGKASRIRKNLTQAELQRYRDAFNNIGVITKVLPSATETSSPESKDAHSSTLSLCPNGTPVLSDAERQHPPISAPDTDHLSIADVGQTLSDEQASPPLPAPDIDHIKLAPAGDELLSPPRSRPVISPQTSHLSLCGVGTPLLDSKPEIKCRPPKTDHLELQ
ncbi:hypothetical protein [Zhongshania marina]|uniref:Uncharacterized protein n=1 Tax=Zhongshania marina TaxID=2304603 RepID=A0A2S4HIF0_9GAMM|nr:hypothetical protein [Marortus luteolus]POP53729.1 hypothetical protein C0068_05515 [Marortus luteolus]